MERWGDRSSGIFLSTASKPKNGGVILKYEREILLPAQFLVHKLQPCLTQKIVIHLIYAMSQVQPIDTKRLDSIFEPFD